jgi:hypothetical protein
MLVVNRFQTRWLGVRLMVALVPLSSLAAAHKATTDENSKPIVLHGKAACLDTAGRRLTVDHDCSGPHHRFGLETADGKLYLFLTADTATAVFVDPAVRQRELQITARRQSNGQLELIKVQSLRDGELYDVSYYCEVCNITTYAPGLCPCCRDELKLIETRATEPERECCS